MGDVLNKNSHHQKIPPAITNKKVAKAIKAV